MCTATQLAVEIMTGSVDVNLSHCWLARPASPASERLLCFAPLASMLASHPPSRRSLACYNQCDTLPLHTRGTLTKESAYACLAFWTKGLL